MLDAHSLEVTVNIADLAIDVFVSDTFLLLSHRANTLEKVSLPPMPAPLANFPISRQGTIGKLSDDVLLNIFRYYLDISPRSWPRLTRICRKWRHIVFASQRVLCLRLHCTHGTPVPNTLDCWPTLPIVVQYGAPPVPSLLATEDEDNIMAALKQSDRVTSISLIVTNSILKNLSAIEKPFSELEDLVLLSRDSVPLTLPSGFQWGSRLRTLHLTRAAIPILPELLSFSKGLVDLQLHEMLDLGYFSSDVFVDALSAMTQLRSLSLSLYLFPFTQPQNYPSFPPQSAKRVVLPALTCLIYQGTSKYLDSFVDKIDAPRLADIDIRFFGLPTMVTSQLSRFINRIEMQKSRRRADILCSEHSISISFSQPEAPSCLELQISCQHLAWQLSYMARVCNELSAFLLGVEHLHVDVGRTTSGKDGNDLLELIRAFCGTKWLHIAGERFIDIVFALQHGNSQMRHKIVLPALCKLCIREPELRYAPLRDAVVSFMHSRWLSGQIIGVEYERLWFNERHRGGTAFVQCLFSVAY